MNIKYIGANEDKDYREAYITYDEDKEQEAFDMLAEIMEQAGYDMSNQEDGCCGIIVDGYKEYVEEVLPVWRMAKPMANGYFKPHKTFEVSCLNSFGLSDILKSKHRLYLRLDIQTQEQQDAYEAIRNFVYLRFGECICVDDNEEYYNIKHVNDYLSLKNLLKYCYRRFWKKLVEN